MTLDALDRKILNILIGNARFSYRQIAQKVHVSAATVMTRVKILEAKGVITAYTTILNPEKIEFDIEVIVEIRIAKGKLFDVEHKIASNNNVVAVYDVTGSFDAIVIARFRTRREMDAFLKKIQQYDFVERTETKFILNTIKEKQVFLPE